MAVVIEQSDEIAAQLINAVSGDFAGRRRMAVAALIGRDDVVAGFGEWGHLVAPAIRQVGEPVGEQDRRVVRVASLVHHQLDAVDGDETGGDERV